MKTVDKVYLKTFGCIQNTSDSERIKSFFWNQGCEFTKSLDDASIVVINTCVIRESAENRAYGLVDKIVKLRKKQNRDIKIIVTGCLVGASKRGGGKKYEKLVRDFPEVDQLIEIERLKDTAGSPLREREGAALINISSGCDNYCSYCIVPMARGREISEPFEKTLAEVRDAIKEGFNDVLLIGQNVNSYGSDLVKGNSYLLPDGKTVKPVIVKSMGKARVPTLFPYLLEEVSKVVKGKVSFVSSNPWDFSDELIEVIAKNKNIDRLIHLPFQSGDDQILKNMNRGYTRDEYLSLVSRIKSRVDEVKFSTDIIVGFPGEDDKAFNNTVEVCKKVGFEIAYINKYSPRKGTVSAKLYTNSISPAEKKRRWKVLDDLVNKKLV